MLDIDSFPIITIDEVIHNVSADCKRSMHACMAMYLRSITAGFPTFFLPKDIADKLGLRKILEFADVYSNMADTDVSIALDNTFSIFRIAPPEFLFGKWEHTLFETSRRRLTYLIPLRKWEMVIDLAIGAKYCPSSLYGEESLANTSSRLKTITNSFILYRRVRKLSYDRIYPHANQIIIAIEIARDWAEESRSVKMRFMRQAQRFKDDYIKANTEVLTKRLKCARNKLLQKPTSPSIAAPNRWGRSGR